MSLVSLAIPYLYILHVLIVSVRVGGALIFAPIWGYPGLPTYVKVILVFSIAAGISLHVPFTPEAYATPWLIFPMEFLIGLLLAMGIRIVFAGLQFAGQLLSFHLGFSAVQAIDPQTLNRSTLMSTYCTLIGYALLLAADQHHTIFRALAGSYQVFQVGASVSVQQWFPALIEATTQIFLIGWKIALPVFVVTFILEVVVGIFTRIQPQLNTMVLTLPLKLMVGLVVLGASLSFLPRVIGPFMDVMVLKR
jgi:flagellar biosynthetic protein FliR